jgi:hypothetical protein
MAVSEIEKVAVDVPVGTMNGVVDALVIVSKTVLAVVLVAETKSYGATPLGPVTKGTFVSIGLPYSLGPYRPAVGVPVVAVMAS